MIPRQSQRHRILALLLESKGHRVPSPALAGISLQYSARIRELRKLGYLIRNFTETVGGQKHGWFALIKEPNERVVFTSRNGADGEQGNQPLNTLAPIGANEDATSNKISKSTFLDHEMGRRGRA